MENINIFFMFIYIIPMILGLLVALIEYLFYKKHSELFLINIKTDPDETIWISLIPIINITMSVYFFIILFKVISKTVDIKKLLIKI